jgi:hypothetical protein
MLVKDSGKPDANVLQNEAAEELELAGRLLKEIDEDGEANRYFKRVWDCFPTIESHRYSTMQRLRDKFCQQFLNFQNPAGPSQTNQPEEPSVNVMLTEVTTGQDDDFLRLT